MTDTVIHCPRCGAEIHVSQILEEEIRHDLEARLHGEMERELKARLEAERERMQADYDRREQERAAEVRALKELLEEKRREETERLQELLRLRQRLEEQELELQKRLLEERKKLEEDLRGRMMEEFDLRLREKDETIRQLQKALEEARHKAQQGSQQIQGEALETWIEERLQQQFPTDRIEPVPKGMRGADLVQEVRDERGRPCGRIAWEAKNTKHWQDAWIDKLKEDQGRVEASMAVVVSVVLPDGVDGFAKRDGVWVCDPRHAVPLAVALREHLRAVAWVKTAQEGREDKLQQLYDYLAGDEFRQRVTAILDAFTALQLQLEKERRAMTKHWAEREKLLQRVITSTSTMYGDLHGIIGARLADVPGLEFDATPVLEAQP